MKKISTSRGFTLIEIVVICAIFFIVTTVGMVSFTQFTSSQTLQSSSQDIISILNTARINAVTQTMPGACTQQLQRYSVKFIPPITYEMWAYCNGTGSVLKNQKLPDGVTFNTGTSAEITFLVASGLSSGGTINLKDASSTRSVQVDTAGNISGT